MTLQMRSSYHSLKSFAVNLWMLRQLLSHGQIISKMFFSWSLIEHWLWFLWGSLTLLQHRSLWITYAVILSFSWIYLQQLCVFLTTRCTNRITKEWISNIFNWLSTATNSCHWLSKRCCIMPVTRCGWSRDEAGSKCRTDFI